MAALHGLGADLLAAKPNGVTAVTLAATWGHAGVLRALRRLAGPGRPGAGSMVDGTTPLMLAAQVRAEEGGGEQERQRERERERLRLRERERERESQSTLRLSSAPAALHPWSLRLPGLA